MNNNNNDNSDITTLFFKIWKNKYLRDLFILPYSKLYNQKYTQGKIHIDFCGSENQYDKFLTNSETYYINQLVIENIDESDNGKLNKLIPFLKSLPSNITNVELKSSLYSSLISVGKVNETIELERDFIPSTVSNFKCDLSKITISRSNVISSKLESLSITNLKYFMDPYLVTSVPILPIGLTSLDLGSNILGIPIPPTSLPKTLKSLNLGLYYNFPFEKQTLPVSLKELILSNEFNQPIDYLPNQLESIEFHVGLYEHQIELHHLPQTMKRLVIGSKCKFVHTLKPTTIPDNVEQLLIYGSFLKPITSFSNRILPKNLKKLVYCGPFEKDAFKPQKSILESIFSTNFNDDGRGGGIPSSLISLRLSPNIIQQLEIQYIPKTLKSLKLDKNVELVDSSLFSEYNSFPCENMTSFEGNLSNFTFKIKDPSKLLKIKIHRHIVDSTPSLFHESKNIIQSYKNLKSVRYYFKTDLIGYASTMPNLIQHNIQELEFVNQTDKPPNFNPTQILATSHCSLPTPYLKCLKLDEFQTFYLSQSNLLPKSLKLLDLHYFQNTTYKELSNKRIFTKSMDITNEWLPPTIEILILRGIDIPSIKLPLPESLHSIYISNENYTKALQDPMSEQLFSIFKLFDSEIDQNILKRNSKLYKKLKKQF